MTIMCNQCANPLKGSEYYEITCRDTKSANDHDIEEKVEEIEKADEDKIKRIEEDKEKRLESYRAEAREEIKDLNDDEFEKLKESLRAEIEEILKKNQTEDTDEDKQSRSSSLEMVGVDNYESKNSIYHVLSLDQHDNSVSGDSLLMLMGSKNETTKGNSSADEFLISLGSSE